MMTVALHHNTGGRPITHYCSRSTPVYSGSGRHPRSGGHAGMSNASAVSNTSDVDEPFLGFTTENEDFNDAWKITLLTELGLLIALVVLCVIYGCCFATSEGKASARARCPTRSRSKRIAPHADPDRVTQEVYDAIHPYFKTRKKNGKLPNLTDGDYHDPDNLDEAGLPKNRLVEGEYHSTQALQLLTRAITMEAMLDKNGIFKKGGDDLQKDPKAAFAQSRPTRRIKAFMSHTWDAVDFDPKRVLQNRAKHADDTTKAIMMHIKFRPLLVVSVVSIESMPPPRIGFCQFCNKGHKAYFGHR
eukprot:6196666-Pleurochrysis_carterae.AAC.1